jgi:hypothetical protein
MDNITITIDNTTWNTNVVRSYTSVSEFVVAHATYDWFTEEYLNNVYFLATATEDKPKGKNK